MKKQFLFILLCALSFAACTQNDQSLDSVVARRTLSASVESVLDYTRAGMESDGAFFWHEGDKIGALMTNGYIRPMTLANGDGGNSTGTFEISTNETIGGYAFFPYNKDSRVNADGKLTINFPAEYNYGSVIGEKENSFGFAMWGQVAHGAVGFKHLGGVFKIYVKELPVGENMKFSLSTPGKKLTGDFTTVLNCETPVLETSDDSENDTVVITFNNTEENATAVFYVPVPVGTYPEIDVVVKDANGEEIAFGYWTNQTVERRAQKKGTIGKKEVTGGEIDGVYSPEAGVYEISNLAGLKWVADQVNQEITTFEGETVKLTDDIDLGGEQWMPIGYWVTFNGTFDGQNHTISNLKHHGTEADCYVGLFGYTENATIKNLTINNVDIKLVADNSWAGGHMGALVGNIDGTTVIENITVSGDVKLDGDMEKMGAGRIGAVVGGNTCNATFKNVNVNANEGSFVKGNSSIGGIAGQLQGQISFENCSSNIDVTAQWFAAGGIIGLAAEHTTFTNCSTSGNISVIAGREGNNEDLYRVGGIAGSWDDNLRTALTLVDCETSCVLSGTSVDGNTASTFDCGGFVGRGYSSVVGAKVIVNGVEYQYYGNGNSVSGGYQYDAEAKLATIYDAEGLKKFAEEVNGSKSFAGETVVLAADIDLGGEEWKPIGMGGKHFEGTFDGQGHTIKGLKVSVRNSGSQAALFCSAAGNAKFKNFTIDEAYVKYPADNADYYASAVVGTIYGNIKFEDITVKNSTITGNNKVGAIFAHDGSSTQITINNCHVDNCYIASEDTADGGCVGGLVGYFATGVAGKPNTISNSSVKNSTIVGINSTNSGKRANSEFIGCILTKETTELNIVDCVVENNTFSQTIDGVNPVTYEGVFPSQFIGGDRAEKLLGVITVNGTRVANKVVEANGVKYATLQEAIANVTDGGVITLIDNVTFTEETRTHNTGTWYDGIYYVGDKSFTLDLNGKTISHDGSVNDYLLNFKNAGSKANTVTIKNGIVDAGTAAFCALCTSSVQENQLTINLENVTLYNNISNGSTAKIRGGAILNVKSGAKIIGKNSYLGIECINSTVNIYEGAEIYMNGTTSYNGCLAGVGGNGTINVNGGYGKGAKGGFIAMTSGGTINISGGEWIANTDGTIGNDSNWYVLTAQSNKYESGFAGGSYINVTGGTFRGGMDAWVLNNIEGEIAEINIKGGNFNADPTNYVDTEYYKVTSNNGSYTVVERKYIYLNAEHWLSDDARLVAYIWTDTISAQWHNMEAVGNTKIYRFELPDNFNYGCNIIFCRMNPSSTANNWNNKWNQTADLKTPTNGNNMLTIPSNGWEGTTGTWSKYTPAN